MGQTLENLYQHMRERLKAVTTSPAQATAEADLIVENLLQLSADALYSRGDEMLSEAQVRSVEDFLRQRVEKRIPIQYLLHQAWFYGLRFYVNPHVLIPRPETELLADEALKYIQPGMRVVDIGTGSGAIPIALSYQLGPAVTVYGTDISEQALRVAEINQKTLGTGVRFRHGNLFSPLAGERFDVILSNPPYIDQALLPSLEAEVVYHEPEVALFSPNPDAYHYYRRLANEAPAYLNPGGRLMVEVGAGMAEGVQRILTEAGYSEIAVIPDYAGIPRIITVCYKPD